MKLMGMLPLAVGFAISAAAQSDEAKPDLNAALGFFVGSCWVGTFSDGASTDIQCFRPVYDGQFVRSNHLVEGDRGPYGGETLFHWDADGGIVSYTYWDTSGGVSQGTMVMTKDGLRAPDEVYVSADGTELTIASAWTITGPDRWQQRVERVSESDRETLWSIDYVQADLSTGPRPDLGENKDD